jgi:hypothetical protein
VPTRTLLDLFTGKAALTPELAERIDAVFGRARPLGRRRCENKADLSITLRQLILARAKSNFFNGPQENR